MKFTCPKGAKGICIGGNEYAADEAGVVELPDHFEKSATAAGYTVVVEESAVAVVKKPSPTL